METKPYYCPNCRSNRTKFRVVASYAQPFMKDAITGQITQMADAEFIDPGEAQISCQVCGFTGNELRFIKQAEREPRTPVNVQPTYR
ncbi:hypothetical protein [Paenibacillus sp. y28]|uniref:hypothetical protein n=1 Tax=Paenibacillus sp. y28 TaxID=3129110 RepID=UPI0030186A3C